MFEFTLQKVDLQLISSFDDISLNWGSISSSNLVPNTTTNVTIDLPWSISGSSSITYSLQNSFGYSVPSWVTLDIANRILIINTTGIAAGTTTSFYIRSESTTFIWDKTVNLQVVGCNVQNWSTCQSNSSNSWQACNSGYYLVQDSSTKNYLCKLKEDKVGSTASTVTQSAVGAVVGATVVFSFWNMSNLQGIWITMNQFQLILLLLLTNSHIPKSIVDYLTGMKATTCSLNFIPFKDLPGLRYIVDWFDYGINNQSLDYFGVFSGSTFVNIFALIWAVSLIGVVHICYLYLFKRLLTWWGERPTCIKYLNKVYQLLTFTIYIRLILEANIFIMLTSLSEIKAWNTTSVSKIASLINAIIWELFWIALFILTFVHWMYNRKLDNIDHYMPLKAFFNGLKNQVKARLYSTILLLRRIFLTTFLIIGSSISSLGIIIPMMIVQFVYLSLFIIVRPYNWVKDNVLEITNEVYYFVMITLLVHFNSDSRWTGTAETLYFCLIVANSITIVLIMISKILINKFSKNKFSKNNTFLGDILIKLCIKLVNKCKPKTAIQPENTIQNVNKIYKV